MNAVVRLWRHGFAPTIVLCVAIVAAPLPCLAGELPSAGIKPVSTLKSSVERAVATQTLAAATPAVRAQEKAGTDLGSKSFFRTPGGMIALLALAAGVGFAVYSTQHDRVKSPAR